MMELTYAKDARVGFLEADSPHLALDPLKRGQLAMYVTSQDFEGITLIGTLTQLCNFSDHMSGVLYNTIEYSKMNGTGEVVTDRGLANRMRAALRLLNNEHITPQGRRILEKILDEAEGKDDG